MAGEDPEAAGGKALGVACDQDSDAAASRGPEAGGDPEPAPDLEAARPCADEQAAGEPSRGLHPAVGAESEPLLDAQHRDLQPVLCARISTQLCEPSDESDAGEPRAHAASLAELPHQVDFPPGLEGGGALALPAMRLEAGPDCLQPVALGRVTSSPLPSRASSKVSDGRVYPEEAVDSEGRLEPSVSQPSLTRVITNYSRLSPVVPTTRCTICLEHFPETELDRLQHCHQVEHGACGACLGMYLKLRIDDGRVFDLKCPCVGQQGCDASATLVDLESFCDPPTVEKYSRFLQLRSDSRARQCPTCDCFCQAELRIPGKENTLIAELHCQACGQDFCYYHSNAHAIGREACAAYERDILKRERAALATFGSKKCPGCGIITDKASGCNHMTCSKCSVEWCWLCGKTITNLNWHYSPLRFGTCQQFADRTANRDHCRLHCMLYVTKVLQYIAAVFVLLFYVLWFFMFLAALLACGCPAACSMLCFKKFEGTVLAKVLEGLHVVIVFIGLVLALAPFVVFAFAWSALMLPLWVLLRAICAADVQQFWAMIKIPFELLAIIPESLLGSRL